MEFNNLLDFLSSTLGLSYEEADDFNAKVLAPCEVYTIEDLHQSLSYLKQFRHETDRSVWDSLECAFNDNTANNSGTLPPSPPEPQRMKGAKPDLFIETKDHHLLSQDHIAHLAQKENYTTTDRELLDTLHEASQKFEQDSQKIKKAQTKKNGVKFQEDQNSEVQHLGDTNAGQMNNNGDSATKTEHKNLGATSTEALDGDNNDDQDNNDDAPLQSTSTKSSNRGSLSAGDEIALLQNQDLVLIDQLLKNQLIMISEKALNSIRSIFDSLDMNGDGVLNPYDFQDDVPCVSEIKQQMWYYLLDYFDYNEDACIEFDEFKQWFILRTLKSSFKMPTDGLTFGQIILTYREQFEKVLDLNIKWIQTNLLSAYEKAVKETSEVNEESNENEE